MGSPATTKRTAKHQWTEDVAERYRVRGRIVWLGANRAVSFAAIGLLAGLTARVLVHLSYQPQALFGRRPALEVAAGAGAALLLWALESGFRRGRRLRQTSVYEWVLPAALLGATAGYGLTDGRLAWVTVGLLATALIAIGVVLALSNKASLPAVGVLVFLVSAVVALGSNVTAMLPAFDDGQIATIVAGGLLIAVGFMVQEFSGSHGWYVILVAGIGGATSAVVARWPHPGEAVLDDWSFLAALLFAFVVGIGLLSWRVLTWGWFWFISAVGCGTLLLASDAGEIARPLGVFVLAVAIVAGAASSFSKTSFRLTASAVAVGVAALTILSGARATSGGDAQEAAIERERLESVETRVIGLHNCLARLFSDPIGTGGSRADTADLSVTATRCSEGATPGLWQRLLLPAGDEALARNATSRLAGVADSIVATASETAEPRPPDDDPVGSGQREAIERKTREAVVRGLEPENADRGGNVDSLGDPEPAMLRIRSSLDIRHALQASIVFRQLELDLVALEIEFLGGSDQAPRANQRRVEAAAAIESLELSLAEEEARSRSLRSLLAAGANDTAAKLFPGRDNNIELGAYGWLALGLAALMGYRRAEIANNRRTSSPITIETPMSDGVDDAASMGHLRATMEAELSRAGVEEPAALPGSVLTDELVELVQNDTLQGSKWVAAAIKALKSIGFPRGGITVRPIVSSDNGGNNTVVTVWVHTTRTQKPLYTETFESHDRADAVRQAAFFVARAALNYGRNVPRWGRWHSQDGVGFRLFNDAIHHRVIERDRDLPVKRRNLEAALTASPPTAQIRVELGHIEDLAGNHVHSLRLHLEARVEHRRLLTAGYRVATSCSMLSGALVDQWFHPNNSPHRAAVVDLLDDYGLLTRASRTPAWHRAKLYSPECALEELRNASLATDHSRTAEILLCVAYSELTRIRHSLTVPAIAAYSSFQSERSYWMRFLKDTNHRRQTTEQYETVRMIVELRLALIRLRLEGKDPATKDRELVLALIRRLDAIIARPQIGSLALYNAACFWSLMSKDADELRDPANRAELPDDDPRLANTSTAAKTATTFLQRSRRNGRGAYPSYAWMTIDPDLEPLRDHQEFKEFMDWMGAGERLLADERDTTIPPTIAPTTKDSASEVAR